jgi:FkbM family methyltransferase
MGGAHEESVTKTPRAFIPHVGWLAHEPGDELVSLLRQGYFESVEQAFAWLYLRPGDWFFDCGAHIGLYSVLAARATGGDARIVAVEANEDTARLLEANLAGNGVANARVVHSAIWSTPGVVRFQRDAPTRSAYARVSFDPAEASTVEVSAVTLDALAESSGAAEIALVKLDVEGVEPEAFAGAAATLARGGCAVWMVEFTEANLVRRGSSTAELARLLSRYGLSLHELSQETLALVPFVHDGPIWFKNLFATRDAEAVNARLRAAAPSHVEVAQDILGRARACARFKDLEELDTIRKVAASNEEWARKTEALLAAERAALAAERAALADERARAHALADRVRKLETWLMPWRTFQRRRGDAR